MITSFEDLEAWQKARVLVRNVYSLTRALDLRRDSGLSGQLQRAAVSVMSNVAEGFERVSIPEKLQFYNFARGSAGETRSLLYVVEDNYAGSAQSSVELRREVVATGMLVSGLIASTQRRRSR